MENKVQSDFIFRRVPLIVAATTYENGSVVYVNYGEDEYTVEGVTIPARSFVVEGGK